MILYNNGEEPCFLGSSPKNRHGDAVAVFCDYAYWGVPAKSARNASRERLSRVAAKRRAAGG